MLANIIDGRHSVQPREPKTTLIVATPALVEQWYEEIHSKVECQISVLRHVGGKKLSSNNDIANMQAFDIVLTTYHGMWLISNSPWPAF
jgi:SNF2 family DNA or RNA helicase